MGIVQCSGSDRPSSTFYTVAKIDAARMLYFSIGQNRENKPPYRLFHRSHHQGLWSWRKLTMEEDRHRVRFFLMGHQGYLKNELHDPSTIGVVTESNRNCWR